MSSIKKERAEMSGAIRQIKFIGDDEKIDDCKEKTKKI